MFELQDIYTFIEYDIVFWEMKQTEFLEHNLHQEFRNNLEISLKFKHKILL